MNSSSETAKVRRTVEVKQHLPFKSVQQSSLQVSQNVSLNHACPCDLHTVVVQKVSFARNRGHRSRTIVLQAVDIWSLQVYSYGRVTVEVIVHLFHVCLLKQGEQ